MYTKRGETINPNFIIGLNYDEFEKDTEWGEEFEEKYNQALSRPRGVNGVSFAFVYTNYVPAGEEGPMIEILPAFISFIGSVYTNPYGGFLLKLSADKMMKAKRLYVKNKYDENVDIKSPAELQSISSEVTSMVEDFYNEYGDEPTSDDWS